MILEAASAVEDLLYEK